MTHLQKKYIEDYKNLKISLQELKNSLPNIFFNHCDSRLTVYTEDVQNLLNSFQSGKIGKPELLNWVNTIWFSDLYVYDELQCDCIASILTELEEADERDNVLSKPNIDKYLFALRNNFELV